MKIKLWLLVLSTLIVFPTPCHPQKEIKQAVKKAAQRTKVLRIMNYFGQPQPFFEWVSIGGGIIATGLLLLAWCHCVSATMKVDMDDDSLPFGRVNVEQRDGKTY